MAKRKADSISMRDLRAAVQTSVKKLNESILVQEPFATHSGLIFGRIVQGDVSLEAAENVAKTITNSVSGVAKKAGLSPLSPAVLKLPGHIIIGFVEQSNSRTIVE